ncbi:tRNA (guanosine(46)-N7)-methyltransferase TrmB [Mycoplasmoides genitalium]|uniref:tRNA (guanine-N(7)-)-methyltransferase n=2 Tax=Mycoplasmoides genitalium TaxID=2097 RepID=TRMB_MYCGE|nr:tRNA (guanosine(46)-N7)-methyltransferase TrmB [Mycoplasmoides genitalium]P47589.1 RecName: Full=tRNA (guanine-N(7)-)-methyltransferase; AltName: Full=tRNA (guanine(46)-N(7))-methyltransferase; AltName: Full=tRNA(m7G46)-methyltransferase [Mycoplasmoides genitalium G37]ABY79452.1 tRNA (guanine-N(7)-)-methyltransferase [synthetic Mycoplasma genitalium JCVI-1.0]AAC71572.1 tRNA (guanine-N(7)-)-methyltransferase [Mycoplasmoides genitalium G37]AFQ03189.1 tRNA (guanine-N(7)-)-methyltransferase [Myc
MRLRKVKNALLKINQSPYFYSKDKFAKFTKKQLVLELGCGKGTFLIKEAQKNNNFLFIGIEREPTIVLKAINKINKLDFNLENILLLCTDAKQLDDYFQAESVQKIFINFPDPWPKKRHIQRRLTSPDFLKLFWNLLVKNGLIEFKTDNDKLFEYTLTTLQENSQIFEIIHQITDLNNSEFSFQNSITEYEQRFMELEIPIKKLVIKKII